MMSLTKEFEIVASNDSEGCEKSSQPSESVPEQQLVLKARDARGGGKVAFLRSKYRELHKNNRVSDVLHPF